MLKLIYPVLSTIFLSGCALCCTSCSSNNSSNARTAAAQTASAPAAPLQTAAVQPARVAAADPAAASTPALPAGILGAPRVFALPVPAGWEVSSKSEGSLPAHATLVKGNNLLTVSASYYWRDLNETCTLASNNFVKDPHELIGAAQIAEGICSMQALVSGISQHMVMARDNSHGVLYSLTTHGDASELSNILQGLQGDYYMQRLKYRLLQELSLPALPAAPAPVLPAAAGTPDALAVSEIKPL